mmetsp:Transcript_61139/g.108750  ORF Transcript_61139/g.108750 Transcript_61139/m.108750 type:complete len:254 (-) Transcript_61139:479-1240(-)
MCVNFLWQLSINEDLHGYALALHEEEEPVSGIALVDDLDVFALEGLYLEGICDGHHLVLVDVAQNGNLLQEVRVLGTLACSGILHDVVEGLSIKLPESCFLFANHCCGARAVVEKGKLSEDVSDRAGLDTFLLSVDQLPAFSNTLLNEEHAFAIISFLDDLFPSCCWMLLERHDHGLHVLLLQASEEEARFEAFLYPSFLLRGLFMHRSHEGSLLIPLPVSLCRDALSRAPVHIFGRLWEVFQVLIIVLLFFF